MTSDDRACRQPPGLFKPEIDLGRCEGKGECLRVCPEDVFALLPIEPVDKARLSILQKFKLMIHGCKVAYALSADRCRACGACVTACPEKAIKLGRAA